MANAVQQIILSGSTQGRRIKVVATTTPGTLVHTTGLAVSTIAYDRLYLSAYNSDTVDRQLTIEFGGVTAPDDNICVTVPAQGGLLIPINGDLLAGDGASGVNIRAFAGRTGSAGTANVLTLGGYAMRVTV